MRAQQFQGSPDPERFTRRIEELRIHLLGKNPKRLASYTGCSWNSEDGVTGKFQFALWDQPVCLNHPECNAYWQTSGKPISPMELTPLLYYFNFADGAPLEERWISFSELPNGNFYNQAFQSYTGEELGRAFGNDLASLNHAAECLGGIQLDLGNASYRFSALPRVPVSVAYWLGDEDFPASAQVLFDASAPHYLTTDSYAILGSTITRRLIASNPKRS